MNINLHCRLPGKYSVSCAYCAVNVSAVLACGSNCVHLPLEICKLFRESFLCDIFKFSFMHSLKPRDNKDRLTMFYRKFGMSVVIYVITFCSRPWQGTFAEIFSGCV